MRSPIDTTVWFRITLFDSDRINGFFDFLCVAFICFHSIHHSVHEIFIVSFWAHFFIVLRVFFALFNEESLIASTSFLL